MKISVLIPSRGRPAMLQDAILSLHCRESGRHKVSYVVGCDADDPGTIAMATQLPVRGHIAPRSPSLGGMVNAMAAANPADVYCSLCDDILALTPGWDAQIAAAWKAQKDGVWWWQNSAEATYAIVSEKWRRAAGRIFTDYFPFWWDDLWLADVWKRVTGGDLLLVHARLEDRRPGTQRMRDSELWADFFWSARSRSERTAEARRIGARLGRRAPRQSSELLPDPAFTAKLSVIERQQGDRGPPTPEYLEAKARVERLLSGGSVPIFAQAGEERTCTG